MSLIAKRTCECEAAAWKLQRMAFAVLWNADAIRGIKAAVEAGDAVGGAQLWLEIDWRDQVALWVAPSKGGVFSTQERAAIREWEWGAHQRDEVA